MDALAPWLESGCGHRGLQLPTLKGGGQGHTLKTRISALSLDPDSKAGQDQILADLYLFESSVV